MHVMMVISVRGPWLNPYKAMMRILQDTNTNLFWPAGPNRPCISPWVAKNKRTALSSWILKVSWHIHSWTPKIIPCIFYGSGVTLGFLILGVTLFLLVCTMGIYFRKYCVWIVRWFITIKTIIRFMGRDLLAKGVIRWHIFHSYAMFHYLVILDCFVLVCRTISDNVPCCGRTIFNIEDRRARSDSDLSCDHIGCGAFEHLL